MQTSLIGREACSGAHFLGRALRSQGHYVRLIAAKFVKPFVKSNKNDFIDAEAIAEAVERENMRFVPIKTDEQLDLQAIHRVRDRLISRRTAVINQLRAFLLERGLVFSKTPSKLRAAMPEILENADANLTPQMFVNATFSGKTREIHPVVPASAVLHLHDRDWVFVPAWDNRFKRVEVHGGQMLPDSRQELLAGISPGQQVVSNVLQFEATLEAQ